MRKSFSRDGRISIGESRWQSAHQCRFALASRFRAPHLSQTKISVRLRVPGLIIDDAAPPTKRVPVARIVIHCSVNRRKK